MGGDGTIRQLRHILHQFAHPQRLKDISLVSHAGYQHAICRAHGKQRDLAVEARAIDQHQFMRRRKPVDGIDDTFLMRLAHQRHCAQRRPLGVPACERA
ncbi:MAG: hypothetical protein EBX37_07905, partial [Alphaproteobacteria bacterium]|nr:hypothetical protein [Alphaproteobacteria bacterium]